MRWKGRRQSKNVDDRRGRSPRRGAAVGGGTLVVVVVAALLFVMLFSVASLSLRFPFWGALKASYALAALVPTALCAGIGGARVHHWLADRFGPTASALFYGWFGAFVATLVTSFAG